jgi:hypothetical protein
MNNKSRLGARAKMCREEASLRWSDPAAEQHWLELAAEYDRLAETEVLMASRRRRRGAAPADAATAAAEEEGRWLGVLAGGLVTPSLVGRQGPFDKQRRPPLVFKIEQTPNMA